MKVGGIFALPAVFAEGAATFGAINNAANAIYYNFFSDGESDLSSDSYSKDGSKYLNRWDRLDYTKKQLTDANGDGEKESYDFNAWMYYSEYNFHMHAWNGLNLLDLEKAPKLSEYAESARIAGVKPHDPFNDFEELKKDHPLEGVARIIAYMLTGMLGI